MSGQQASPCCCGCFYAIQLCSCENDRCCCGGELPPNPCNYYIACALADAFFDANPFLGNHLVFGFFDPCAPDGECCYELIRGDNVVQSVPPDGLLLQEIPPPPTWYVPPFDDCQFCCPTPCCQACCLEPGINPACCFRPDTDLLMVTIERDGFSVTNNCCVGGSEATCDPLMAVGTYAMAGCHLWFQIAGDPCLYTFIRLTCTPPGWSTSEDHFCTNLCNVVGKCADFKPCFGRCALDCIATPVDKPDLCDGFGFDVLCEELRTYNCGAMPPGDCICQDLTLRVRVNALSHSCFQFPDSCCDQPCACTPTPLATS